MSALTPINGATLAVRRIALVDDAASAAALAGAFAAFGWMPAEAVKNDLDTAITAIEQGAPPALLIVDIDAHDDPMTALAGLAEHVLAGARVLALGTANDVALFRALLDAGVSDYLPKPITAEAAAAALRRICEDATDPPGSRTGRLAAVMGVRGGCGASMVAASLAWAIANLQLQRGVLVDLDLYFGSAALTFGLEPGSGLAAMLATPGRLDEQLVAGALQSAGERLGLVASATPLETATAISGEAVTALMATLRQSADWVVADLPRGLDEAARQLLRTADKVVLVAPPTLAGLRDAGRMATYITDLRAGSAPLLVVNGGSDSADGMRQHLFEENLGEAVAAWVPALPGPAAAAEAHGLPLAAVAGGVRGGNPFETLATLVTGNRPAADPQRAPRWWPWRG